MSQEYDNYLKEHKADVLKAYKWLEDNGIVEKDWTLEHHIKKHDDSKYSEDEYMDYDMYFYEDNDPSTRSEGTKQDFLYAFLHHLHNNPHHWQYWVLIQDTNEDSKEEVLEMPRPYAIEMICDWWSFSWAKYNKSGNISDLYEIIDWYNANKDDIKLHVKTRQFVEDIIANIMSELIKM